MTDDMPYGLAAPADGYGSLTSIENLVGIMKLRKHGYSTPQLAQFDKYSDIQLAQMLCSLAVSVFTEIRDHQPQ